MEGEKRMKLYLIEGIRYNARNQSVRRNSFEVRVTKDEIGATLSIADMEKGIQYSIPIDEILRDLQQKEKL